MLSANDIHKVYINNVDAFYKAAGGRFLAPETDEFLHSCAVGLWSKSGGVTARNAELINELYSKDQTKPNYLYWELTSAVCDYSIFRVPDFFIEVVATDRRNKTSASRTLIRIMTNLLLELAADDEDVSIAEANFITSCSDALMSVCDRSGVVESKKPLNAANFITSPEKPFLDGIKAAPAYAPNQDACEKQAEKASPVSEEPRSLESLMEELNGLIGLDNIKKDVKSLINLIKVRKLRIQNGLAVPPVSLHMVFMGNPGTGKTTVARLLSGIYKSMGVLSKGQLVEADRSALVAGFVGQTAIKTSEIIQKAKGGILFIDEAYSLTPDAGSDFGREAIEIILKSMEDNRDDLVVIVAGYEDLMNKFISSNPGLESRFSKYFVFEDYNGEQLYAIFALLCKKHEYILAPEAAEKTKALLKRLYESRDENFGNARDVRNLFEKTMSNQCDRVAAIEAPKIEDLMELRSEDIPDSLS